MHDLARRGTESLAEVFGEAQARQIGQAVVAAIQQQVGEATKTAPIIVINNLTVKVQINSAHGGGATIHATHK
ncbi:hypothetical protein HYT05_00485 [Candidatus Kaiserbacteria bacterium]|nr:hypothetical protein [Candidatus Kaiserbacteria bacterium]